MKKEFSAGGIVFQKKEDKMYWLMSQHSQHKGWVFPKGMIGDFIEGESKVETALREVKEETGVEGKIVVELKNPVSYWYVWEGEKRYKTVYYFLMEFVSGDITDHDDEMSAVEWVETDKVVKKLTYSSDRIAFAEAIELIKHMPS